MKTCLFSKSFWIALLLAAPAMATEQMTCVNNATGDIAIAVVNQTASIDGGIAAKSGWTCGDPETVTPSQISALEESVRDGSATLSELKSQSPEGALLGAKVEAVSISSGFGGIEGGGSNPEGKPGEGEPVSIEPSLTAVYVGGVSF